MRKKASLQGWHLIHLNRGSVLLLDSEVHLFPVQRCSHTGRVDPDEFQLVTLYLSHIVRGKTDGKATCNSSCALDSVRFVGCDLYAVIWPLGSFWTHSEMKKEVRRVTSDCFPKQPLQNGSEHGVVNEILPDPHFQATSFSLPHRLSIFSQISVENISLSLSFPCPLLLISWLANCDLLFSPAAAQNCIL